MTTFTAPGTVMALTLCTVLSSAHLGGESTDAVAAATHKAIHQFEARVAETPRDYLSYTILGQLQGRLARETGNLDAYRRAEAALRLLDGYYIALDGLADVRAAQGRDTEAIELLEQAVSRAPQPGSLVALGDLYTRRSRLEAAERVYRQAEAIAKSPGNEAAYRRELAVFYADHDRNLPQALSLAQQDLASRPDIHGYDTLAWTLYKSGRFEEAAAAMTRAMARAMALGTVDGVLYVHAALIEDRNGRTAKAREHLNAAKALTPYLLNDEARQLDARISAKTAAVEAGL